MFAIRSSWVRVLCAVLALSGMMAGRADARVWVGVGFGVPFYGPPVYVPPPVYYVPPPVYYQQPGSTFSYTPPVQQPQDLGPDSYGPPQGARPQPGYGARGYGQGGYTPSMGTGPAEGNLSCRAGAYVCPLLEDTPPGGQCSCPGRGGQYIAGRAG